MPPELRQAARAYGRTMEQISPTAEEVARVRQLLHARLGQRPGAWRVRFLLPATVMALVVAVVTWQWPWPADDWALADNQHSCAQLGSDVVLRTSGCSTTVTVVRGNDAVRVEPDSELAWTNDHEVRLRVGRARFEIEPRQEQGFRVQVAVGVVEVVGTTFSVWQDAAAGGVEVVEGKVMLRMDGGEEVLLRAGSQRRWVIKPAPTADAALTPEPVAGTPRRPDKASVNKRTSRQRVEELLTRQFQLRAQRRFDEALRALRRALESPAYSRRQKSRLSLEVGRVLEQQGKTAAACRHWRRHARSFGKASLDDDAARFLRGCD